MSAEVWIALIGLPANLLLAYATYRKARSADHAVNGRVTRSTISNDIADVKMELRALRTDIVWLTREFVAHVKEHHAHERDSGTSDPGT